VIEVEPFKNTLSEATDSQLLGEVNEFTLKSATVVDLVSAKILDNDVQIIVKTNAQSQYSDFTLRNPSRIVLDVIGARNAFGYKTLNINSSTVSRVRVGQPSTGVVRIVLDSNKNIPYKIIRDGVNLIITTGDAALR
jgi:hypothetical protein